MVCWPRDSCCGSPSSPSRLAPTQHAVGLLRPGGGKPRNDNRGKVDILIVFANIGFGQGVRVSRQTAVIEQNSLRGECFAMRGSGAD